jgi:hypothetical protein
MLLGQQMQVLMLLVVKLLILNRKKHKVEKARIIPLIRAEALVFCSKQGFLYRIIPLKKA